MNASWRLFLGLLAVGLPSGFAAAQAPPGPETLSQPPAVVFSAADAAPTSVLTAPNSGAAPIDRSGIIAGVGLYVIQPFFQNNPAYTVLKETVVDRTVPPPPGQRELNLNQITLNESVDRVNVSHHMDVAPLIWLGYIDDDGFGGRARWWGYRQGTSQSVSLAPFAGTYTVYRTSPTPPEVPQTGIAATGTLSTVVSAAPLGLQAFGDTLSIQHGPEATTLTVTTELSLQVVDLELLQGFRAAGCNFLFAGGVRLAWLDQTYNAYDFQSTSLAELRTLLSSYNFAGVGPTVALEGRRPLGDSGFGLYGMARGSLVFGSATQTAQFGGQELRNNDPNPQFVSQHWERALPVGELEAGVEYGARVGGSWLFGQLALVGQEWFNAGSASRAALLTAPGVPRPVIGGAPVDSNIAFLGLSVRLGLEY